MRKLKYLIFLLYLVIAYLVITKIYYIDNFVWNNDLFLNKNIKPHLEKIIVVHFIALTTISAIGLAMVINRSKRSSLFLLTLFLLISSITISADSFFLEKENYFVWKYQLVSEENSSNINFSKQNIIFLLHDLNNKNENIRIRSRIALALRGLDIEKAYKLLGKIACDKNENIYLRFNCLKSIKSLNKSEFEKISQVLKQDSVIILYNKYEK